MASFSAGTTFTDGVANDVTAAKLAALVNNATPTSGLIQDRTAETIIATNDAFLFGDASDSNNLKRITVANFTQTLPTAKVTTGTIETATLGTTTGTAASFSGDLTIADKIVHSGDTNTAIRFPAADTVTVETAGTERVRVDSSGNVGIGTATTDDAGLTITKSVTRDNGWDAKLALQSTGPADYPTLLFSGCSATNRYGAIVQTTSTSGASASPITSSIEFINTSATQGAIRFLTNDNVGTTSPSESLRIDSSGNVGIGTTSPTIISSNSKIIDIVGDASGAVRFERTNSTNPTYGYVGATNGAVQLRAQSNTPLLLSTNDTERLRIDSSGNVGVGTTAPVSKLTIQGGFSDQIILRDNATNSQDKGATYSGAHYTNAEEPVLVAGGFSTNTQNIVYVGGGWSTGNTATDIRFFTAANNTTVTGTERLRIDSDGDVSIGTATALSKLHVHGNITLSNTTTATSAGTSTITPPATVAGYLTVSINGTSRKIPYYAT